MIGIAKHIGKHLRLLVKSNAIRRIDCTIDVGTNSRHHLPLSTESSNGFKTNTVIQSVRTTSAAPNKHTTEISFARLGTATSVVEIQATGNSQLTENQASAKAMTDDTSQASEDAQVTRHADKGDDGDRFVEAPQQLNAIAPMAQNSRNRRPAMPDNIVFSDRDALFQRKRKMIIRGFDLSRFLPLIRKIEVHGRTKVAQVIMPTMIAPKLTGIRPPEQLRLQSVKMASGLGQKR